MAFLFYIISNINIVAAIYFHCLGQSAKITKINYRQTIFSSERYTCMLQITVELFGVNLQNQEIWTSEGIMEHSWNCSVYSEGAD